jgi:phosphopantothenoylcysteine decarboxylase/phosphopantothenate--cysteine ligase
MEALRGKRVLLGVTGGIAAYKAPVLVRDLIRAGAQVRVVLTRAATHFVAPLALQAVSGSAVGVDLFDARYEEQIGHIELARWADAVLIAPVTADFLAKMAQGMADDLLSTVLLATRAPIVLAPAMNTQMWEHGAVQANVQRIVMLWNAIVVPPDPGELACGEVGAGRLPDSDVLLDVLAARLSPPLLLGRRVLVTVGGTREHLDDVRFLSNASSGRMGFAMAQVARQLGGDVTIVAGSTSVPPPPRWASLIGVESAQEMLEATRAEVEKGVDIAVFTAAVADFRPHQRAPGKPAKDQLAGPLDLAENPDILATIAALTAGRPYCVGFAAETDDVERRTIEKCRRKGCDLMVGNLVGPGLGFDVPENTVVVTNAAQSLSQLGPAGKSVIANQLWKIIAENYAENGPKSYPQSQSLEP